MLGGTSDDVITTATIGKTIALNSKIISLSGATSEDHFMVSELKNI